MSTTKTKLAEQALLYLGGGRTPAGQKVNIKELIEIAGQIISSLLKTEYFQSNIGIGETIPNGLVLAEYPGIKITKYRNVSSAMLPAYPVKLPLNMGVFSISSDTDVTNEFIPLQQGDIAMLTKEPLISSLLGQTGYEVNGMRVVFNQDLTLSGTVTPTVTLRLVVMDISQYGEFDILPIPADFEWPVLQAMCKFFGVEPDPNKIVDPGNKTDVSKQTMA